MSLGPIRLRDPAPMVREHTLVVLTHLILNDMVKVKGQISELALCLQDPQPSLSDRAKLFFLELSKKVTSVPVQPLHVQLGTKARLPFLCPPSLYMVES